MHRTLLARVGLAALSGILAAGGLTAPAAAADEPVVTGTLTGADGSPVAAAFVTVEDPETGETQYTYTDESGAYATGVSPGTYRVSFGWRAQTQWAYQKTTADEAATFAVGSGETVRVDDRLLATGSLGGHLTRWDGTPLVGSQVTLYREDRPVAYAYTDDAGAYTVEGVLPGDYKVGYWHTTEHFVPGASDLAGARSYTVVAGAATTVDDAVAAPATLRGRLVDTAGQPQASYAVYAYPTAPGNWQTYAAETDQNGEWSIAEVPAGDYRVSFTNPQQTRVQWAYGQPDRASATLISVTSGTTVAVDDTWLPETTLVVKAVDAVTKAPIGSFCVQAWEVIEQPVCSDADGVVTVAGLRAGGIEFNVETPATGYYAPKWGVEADLAANRTTTVTVPLVLGGKVALTATDRATGQTVRSACFSLKQVGRPETFGSGCTDSQGAGTTAEPVAPGTYEVFVTAPGSYGHQWLGRSGGTGDQRAAARVVVKAGRTTTAPAARLDPAGTITGVVTGSDGAPLNRVNVAFRAIASVNSGESDGVFTDAAGRYSIGKLGPYAWPLLFSTKAYPYQWSGNTGNRFAAVRIPVRAGGTSAYDMVLRRSATLRGTITPAAAREVRLVAHNAVTGDVIGIFHGYDGQNEIAAYELPLAGGQQVKLQWNLYSGAAAPTWHANASDIGTATKVGIPASGVKRLNLTHH